MTIPSLPTDNLYKFIFLSGLTLLFTALVLFYTQSDSIKAQIRNISTEQLKLQVESTFLKDDLDRFERKISSVENVTKSDLEEMNQVKKSKVSRAEKLRQAKVISDRQLSRDNGNNELELHLAKIIETQRKLEMNSKLIQLKNDILKSNLEDLRDLSKTTMAIILIGTVLSIYGGLQWYNLIQKTLDEKMLYELQKAKLEVKLLENQSKILTQE